MAERSISYRLSLKDADIVKKALTNLGDEGSKALKKIEAAGEPASKGLKAVDAVSGELQGSLMNLSGRAGIAGNVLSSLGPAGLVAAAGIGAVAIAVHKGLSDFIAAEESGIRLEAVLKATGNTAGLTGSQIKAFAEDFERSTKFSGEQIADAASVMLTFKSITGDTFFQAQTLAADLAAVLKSDLSSATLQVGKALENPVEGINALKRAGVSFTEEQKKLIESLVDSGQLYEAQQMVLQTLEGQVGGTATALGTQGLGGALDTAMDASGDMAKAIGGLAASGGVLEERIRDVTAVIDALTSVIQNAPRHVDELGIGILGVANALGIIDDKALDSSIDKVLNKQAQAATQAATETDKAATASQAAANNNKAHAESIQGIIDTLQQESGLLKLSSRDREIQEKTTKIINDARKDGIAISKEERAQIEKSVAANVDLANANKKKTEEKKKDKDALEDYIAKLKEEGSEIGKSAEAVAISRARREAENAAIKDGLSLTDASVQKRIAEAKAIAASNYQAAESVKKREKAEQDLAQAVQKAADKQQAEAEKAQEEFEKPFRDAGENIQDYFAKTFADIAKNGKFSMQDAADYGKDAFFQMAGEIAAALIFRPVIQPVISQAMTTFSPGSGGGASSGLGGFSSLGSLAGASGAINSFGTKLGFSSGLEAARPATASNLVGPMQPGMSNSFVGPMPQAQGSLFGGTTLMGALGGAAMGATIGSMNLFGGNGTGSTIGGTVGGMAGSFFGPLGSIAGSAIGSGIGGLFGPGAKVSAAEFAGMVGANDNLEGLSYGAKNGQVAQARGLSDALGASLAGLVANGIDIANENIRGAINSKSGNRFEALGQRFEFDPQDAESVSLAVAKLSVELAKAGNNTGSLGIALQHIQTDGRKAEEILSDLNFAAMYDQLDKVQEPASQYTAQIEATKKQYEDMIPVAERLGLATDKVTKAQQNAINAFQIGFTSSVASQILQLTDPLAAQIQEENARYQAQLRDAQALGVSLTQVQELHYLKMQQIAEQAGYFQEQIAASQLDTQQTVLDSLEEQASAAQDALKSFQAISSNYAKTLQDLQLSDLSPLSPEDRLAAARSQVDALRPQALLGDISAMSQLEDAVKTFLTEDKEFNGSGGTYTADFIEMQDLLGQVKGVADRQIPLQQQMYNTATDQLSRLKEISAKTGDVAGAISNLSQSLLSSFFSNNSSAGLFSDSSLLPKGKDASYLDSMTAQGVTVRQYHILGRLAGYSGEYGAGGFDAWAKNNPAGANMFNQLLTAQGGTMRQFAEGGITPRNQLFSVGERGTELMFSGSQHAVFSAEQSKKMLSGGSNDNSALIAEIRALRQEMQGLVRITAMSGDMNNEGLASINYRLQTIENKARLEAAR